MSIQDPLGRNPLQAAADRQMFFDQSKKDFSNMYQVINDILGGLNILDRDSTSASQSNNDYYQRYIHREALVSIGSISEPDKAAKMEQTNRLVEQVVNEIFPNEDPNKINGISNYLKSKCAKDNPREELEQLKGKLREGNFRDEGQKFIKLNEKIALMEKNLNQETKRLFGSIDLVYDNSYKAAFKGAIEYLKEIDLNKLTEEPGASEPITKEDIDALIKGLEDLWASRKKPMKEIDADAFIKLFKPSLLNRFKLFHQYLNVVLPLKQAKDDLVNAKRKLAELTTQKLEKKPSQIPIEQPKTAAPEMPAQPAKVDEPKQQPKTFEEKPEVPAQEALKQQPLREPAQPMKEHVAQSVKTEEKPKEPVKVQEPIVHEPPVQPEPSKVSLPKEPKVVAPAGNETVTNKGKVHAEVVEDVAEVVPEAPVEEARVEEKQPEPPRPPEQGAGKPVSRNPFVRFFSWVSSLFTRFINWLRR